ACLSVAMICVSVNFDVRMEPPDLGTMPERSTYAVSADRGSLRMDNRVHRWILANTQSCRSRSSIAATLRLIALERLA
ncbi:hypothetical protein, partial [Xanthomonas perforans]|uniref:hypothetical protein n=1 Tax=Xanthomonas perforans TaxID=442694 RepID=UPI002358FDF7